MQDYYQQRQAEIERELEAELDHRALWKVIFWGLLLAIGGAIAWWSLA